MKKTFLFTILAVVFLSIVATGTASAGILNRFLVGQWDMSYDWDCDGTTAQTTWTLNSDGTFSSSGGGTGVWTQRGRSVDLQYNTGCMPLYSGRLQSLKSMSGTMECTDGTSGSGCFNATKIEGTTSAEDVYENQDEGSPDSPYSH
jgi:hypothetical protein